MALTLGNIKTMVRALTKEPYPATPTFATDARVLMFANMAQLELASRTKSRTATNVPNSLLGPSDVTVANQPQYSYPSNIMEIIKLTVRDVELFPTTYDDLVKMNGGTGFWKQASNCVAYAIVDLSGTRKIWLYQTPAVSGWEIAIWGVKRPTDLTVDASVIDLDERLHKAVGYKVCQDVEEMRREQSMASYFESKCEAEILKYMASGQDTNERVGFLPDSYPSD